MLRFHVHTTTSSPSKIIDCGFIAISDTASNTAISGSIFAVPLACFVMTIAFPAGTYWLRRFAGVPVELS